MKYTIVYTKKNDNVYATTRTVHFDRVETDDLYDLFDEEEKYQDETWFVFEGWPKLEGEKEEV